MDPTDTAAPVGARTSSPGRSPACPAGACLRRPHRSSDSGAVRQTPVHRALDAGRQLARCFGRARRAARPRCARARCCGWPTTSPSTPTTPTAWTQRATRTPQAVLRRHGITDVRRRAARAARRPRADRRPGAGRPRRPGWTGRASPRPRRARRRAAPRARAAADRPRRPAPSGSRRDDQRRALAPPARPRPTASADRSVALGARAPRRASTPTTCAAGGSPRRPGWRSPTSSSRRSTRVERPVGVFARARAAATAGSSPRRSRSTRSALLAALGASIDRDLRAATLPARRDRRRCSSASNLQHAARRRRASTLDSGRQLGRGAHARARQRTVSPGAPRDPRDRWGRLLVRRRSHTRPGRHRARRARHCASSRSRPRGSRAGGSAPRRVDEHHAQPQRGDGTRRGRPDRDRARPAAAAVLRGRRRSSRTPSASGA